ncbi:Uu.00g113450.m01.CDS01 [Anthostomella pinea]|uniref:Uu.00g113450.m01.CDS01 n=1 Tax=Anthostomella pinea TaxID=933095 RepID=A0AAI8VFZ8_9PEZI|nr:Uu.00g113450.m01.CDS01 [Anthostomella pinea]
MGSWTGFLLTYLLGGVTFIPLIVIAVLLHAHLTFPVRDDAETTRDDDTDGIVQPGDETTHLKAAQKDGIQKLKAESDVAAGYFAVCREYTPMGINAKPIERSTPMGSTTVAAPSPSVYQSMYRSIFDRKQPSSPLDDHKSVSQRPKKAGNVFYVVLRHGHLMLFDDDEQLEVRHVVSLAYHNISIYSGADRTPEGELFIKRNALCLSRKVDGKELAPDTQLSKPFYLFSENCSAKEDFYFAMLRNQEQSFATHNGTAKPRRFDVKNIISLVQRLHSSEDHLQTRWLNAFLGRIFLGVYKTKDIENLIKEKLTKKIARVNRPSFLTKIAIQNIDTGDSAPYITNPRLKDLNVEGECVMEADIKYTGNFRLEVAATARIDLGARFKAREVNLVLAVVLRKLEGHVFFKIKPPPSNRIWFSFHTTPKMEMTIEPIVSSRQITYTMILRQIENRIKEVVAETLVSPFWDDIPFFNTEHKHWRGGIFEGDNAVEHSPDYEEIAAQLGHVDEVGQMEHEGSPTPPDLPMEKSQSMPFAENNQSPGFWSRKLHMKKSSIGSGNQSASASTSVLVGRNSSSSTPEAPRPIRKGSFSASSPVVATDPAHAEAYRPSSTAQDRDDAASQMASISAKSQNGSPVETPASSPSKAPSLNEAGSLSSDSPSEATAESQDNERTPTGQGRRNTSSSTGSTASDNGPPSSPVPSSRRNSIKSGTGSIGRGFFSRKEPSSPVPSNGTPEHKRNTLAAVTTAAATAKRWGWNAIQRQGERNANGRKLSDPTVDLNQPMGRGQPLPPPGTPLPGPGKKATPTPVSKRKTVAPPPLPSRQSMGNTNGHKSDRRPVPPPPLPRRRRVSHIHSSVPHEENDFVLEAPAESEPGSPPPHDSPPYVRPWAEDAEGPEESENLAPDEPLQESHVPARDVGGDTSDAVEERAPAAAETADEDDYSNWIDNPEFKQEDNSAAKVEH